MRHEWCSPSGPPFVSAAPAVIHDVGVCSDFLDTKVGVVGYLGVLLTQRKTMYACVRSCVHACMRMPVAGGVGGCVSALLELCLKQLFGVQSSKRVQCAAGLELNVTWCYSATLGK